MKAINLDTEIKGISVKTEKSLMYRIIRRYFDVIPADTIFQKLCNEDEARKVVNLCFRLKSENGCIHVTGGELAEIVSDFESDFGVKWHEPKPLTDSEAKNIDTLLCHYEYCNELGQYSKD